MLHLQLFRSTTRRPAKIIRPIYWCTYTSLGTLVVHLYLELMNNSELIDRDLKVLWHPCIQMKDYPPVPADNRHSRFQIVVWDDCCGEWKELKVN